MDTVMMHVPIAFGWQDGVGGVVGASPGSAPAGAPQTTTPGSPGATGGGGGAASPFGSMMFPLLLGFLVLMVVTTVMSGRREKREKKNLMEGLKRHDKVQLSGGMIGTIMEIKPDEVVVRVDENNKTTIRFVKSAVLRVLESSKSGGGSSKADAAETTDSDEQASGSLKPEPLSA